MKKLKEIYGEAEIEIIRFRFSDIVTTSIEDDEDSEEEQTAPGSGDWDNKGWN